MDPDPGVLITKIRKNCLDEKSNIFIQNFKLPILMLLKKDVQKFGFLVLLQGSSL